jgi:transcriptional regulator with XRE-family HTH domain
MKGIGLKIKKYRKSRGLSQLELEAETKLSPGSLSRIEREKINPTKETLCKIAMCLYLDRDEIIDLFCIEQIAATSM